MVKRDMAALPNKIKYTHKRYFLFNSLPFFSYRLFNSSTNLSVMLIKGARTKPGFGEKGIVRGLWA